MCLSVSICVRRKNNHLYFIAVHIYCLVMISIDLSETAKKSTLEIRDKIQSKTKCRLKQNLVQNFVPD